MIYVCNTGLDCADCIGGCEANLEFFEPQLEEQIQMGVYINPTTCTKETWLASFGAEIERKSDTLKDLVGEGDWLVCLVDNGAFTAAGVMFSQREFEAFYWEGDPRPKRWFVVSGDDLKEVLGEEGYNKLTTMKDRTHGL